MQVIDTILSAATVLLGVTFLTMLYDDYNRESIIWIVDYGVHEEFLYPIEQ